MKKVTACILLTALCVMTLFCGLFLGFTNRSAVTERKAMILIPGLEGSALFDYDTNEAFWALTPEVISLIADMGEDYTYTLFDNDDEQTPKLLMRPGRMDDTDGVKYSLFDVFKNVYLMLEEKYADEYELVVWQYDWRQSNVKSAEDLEQFINSRGYTSVQLYVHSMGGSVVSNYITKEANRKKVELLTAFSSPFFGSVCSYENIFFEGSAILNMLLGPKPFLDSARKLPCVTELFCTDLLNESPTYTSGSKFWVNGDKQMTAVPPREAFFSIDGIPVGAERTEEYISSTFSWTKTSSGKLYPSYANSQSYQSRLLLPDGEGGYKHITKSVPTIYIGGTEYSTISGFDVNSDTNEITAYRTMDGDGMVPTYSATAGTPYDAENVILVSNVDHLSIANNKSVVTRLDKLLEKFFNGTLRFQ